LLINNSQQFLKKKRCNFIEERNDQEKDKITPTTTTTTTTTKQVPPANARRCYWPERIQHKKRLHEEGIALMEAKKYEEARTRFLMQLEMIKCLWKRSLPLYNLACCEALLGNVDSALAYLSQSINAGYRNLSHIERDPDLNVLHGLDAFELLLSELRENPIPEKCVRLYNKKVFRELQKEVKSDLTEIEQPVIENVPEPVAEPVIEDVPELVSESVIEDLPELVSEPVIENVSEPVPESTIVEAHEITSQQPEEYASEQLSLVQMGFTNKEENLRVLRATKGNLSEAVVILLS